MYWFLCELLNPIRFILVVFEFPLSHSTSVQWWNLPTISSVQTTTNLISQASKHYTSQPPTNGDPIRQDTLYMESSNTVYFRRGMRLQSWLPGYVWTSFERLSGRMPAQVVTVECGQTISGHFTAFVQMFLFNSPQKYSRFLTMKFYMYTTILPEYTSFVCNLFMKCLYLEKHVKRHVWVKVTRRANLHGIQQSVKWTGDSNAI
jgi:hypothetical protein